MIKDLSLDAIQLCERDGEAFPFHTAADPVSDWLFLHVSPSLYWKQV